MDKLLKFKFWLIPIFVLVAYFPAINGEFVFDSQGYILKNTTIIKSGGLWDYITSPIKNHSYTPIMYIVFKVLYEFGHEFTWHFHLTNIALHILNTFLLIKILEKFKVSFALWVGVLFAIHPVAVGTVAWIFQIRQLLTFSFSLSSALLFLNFLDSRNLKTAFACVLLYLCSLLTKGSTVTLPVIMLVMAYSFKKRLELSHFVISGTMFTLAILKTILSLYFHNDVAISTDYVSLGSFANRLVMAGKAFWFYIFKAILPINLMFIYPKFDLNPNLFISWIPYILLILLLLISVKITKEFQKLIWLTVMYISLTLLPVLGFVDIGFLDFSHVSDHYQYLSYPAIIFAMLFLANKYLNKKQFNCLFSLVTLVFITISFAEAKKFSSEEAFAKEIISDNPNSNLGYFILGGIEYNNNNFDLAEKYYKKTLELKPNHKYASQNLGNVYYQTHQYEKARNLYLAVLKSNTVNNDEKNRMLLLLGYTFLKLTDYKNANFYLSKALIYFPEDAELKKKLLYTKNILDSHRSN